METIKKTITDLTYESVSVLTQKFITYEGTEIQVGGNHRISYTNTDEGREQLRLNEPEYIVNSVLSVWDNPQPK